MATLAVDQTGEARPMQAGEIPIIDFAPFRTGGMRERKQVAAAIGEACESCRLHVPRRPRHPAEPWSTTCSRHRRSSLRNLTR